MSQGFSFFENHDKVCEALNCFDKATNKVAIEVGSRGSIVLFLCDSCKPKVVVTKPDINHSKLETQNHDKL